MAKGYSKKDGQDRLAWKRENGWARVSPAEARRIEDYAAGYIRFLSVVKTEREAYREAEAQAVAKGYAHLDPRSALPRKLAPGDRVLCGCKGKTLLLARIGKRSLVDGVHVLGGHTDAPRLDAKPVPLYEDGEMVLLDTRYYGGVRKYQWVARPLALHGTVVKQGGEIVPISIGEDPADPVFVITDLLPHLAKEQRVKTLEDGITGEGLNVLFGSRPPDGERGGQKDKAERIKHHMLELLHRTYGIDEEDFVSAELEIVPAGPARDLGLDRSMILGYAHDDRSCSYAALRALLDLEKTPEFTSVVLLCDKEEVGSIGATGMDSTFFENTIAELLALQSADYSNLLLRRCLARSRMISADVGVLHDPNYPEVSSPNNMARINAGVVLEKYVGAGGKSGSSEASAEFMAHMRRVFNEAGVVWQSGELGKVDMGGGGTIAKFLARYGMDVVDCGPGVLTMHAPCEVVGKLDAYMAFKGYQAFLADAGPRGA